MEKKEENNEIIIYEGGNGKPRIEVRVENESVWLTQEKIAELFGVQRPAITKHLKNIFESGELIESEVSSILEHTTRHGAIEGKTQTTTSKLYNLDAIISIGYRVNSATAGKPHRNLSMPVPMPERISWGLPRLREPCQRAPK